MICLDEYLLRKTKQKAESVLDPVSVFKKLCKGHLFNENILHVLDAFEQYLEDGIFKEHVSALLDLIDKAADDGYIMNYADKLESYYMYFNGKKEEAYWTHPKTIRVGNTYSMIVVNFLNLELSKPMLYTVCISGSSVEVSIYEAGTEQHMINTIHNGLIRWSIDYNTNDINDVEKFKDSANKRLGI